MPPEGRCVPDGSAQSPILKGKRSKPENPKIRSGKWTEEEHRLFLEALELYGNVWKNVEAYVGTRTCAQIRSHSQKYFQGVRAKMVDELRRTGKLEGKVFIVVKEYRNYTGSQAGAGIIESVGNGPVTPTKSEIKAEPLDGYPQHRSTVDVPHLLLDPKDEPGFASGMYRPGLCDGAAGLEQEEIKMELSHVGYDVQQEHDYLMGKLPFGEDVVQDVFPPDQLIGEISPHMDQAMPYQGYFSTKRRCYDPDVMGVEGVDSSSFVSKFNYDQ